MHYFDEFNSFSLGRLFNVAKADSKRKMKRQIVTRLTGQWPNCYLQKEAEFSYGESGGNSYHVVRAAAA